MRNIWGIVIALALGGSVGYLAGSSGTAPTRTGGGERERVPERTRPAPAPESNSPLSRALHELPIPSYTAGTGSIIGTVLDAEGNGLAGVTIRADQVGQSSRSWRKGDPPPAVDSLEETVRKAVKRYHWRNQTTVEAVSDENGAYRLEGLADRGYNLRAYLAGYTLEPTDRRQQRNVKPGGTVDWTARAITSVPVDVFLPDGSRPETAWILCREGQRAFSERWSPKHRQLRLPPGAYTLSVSIAGQDDLKADPIQVNLQPNDANDPIAFRLKGRPGIRGKVVFPRGEQFSNLRVYALRFTGDETPKISTLSSKGKESWVSEHNQFGYSFLDLLPGRYLVGVGARKGAIFAKTTVDVAQQTTQADLVVDQIDPSLYVVLRIAGPDGNPVPVGQLMTSYKTENSSSSGGGAWARRLDGSYIVFYHEHDYEDGGTFGITVTSPDFGRRKVEYKRGGKRELEIRFAAAARLEVVVSNYTGSKYADRIRVGLRRTLPGTTETSTDQKPLDAEGKVTLGPVEVGAYELILVAQAGRHSGVTAASRPVTLAAGNNEASIAIPALHELVVRGKQGERYTLRAAKSEAIRFWDNKRCGEDGRAVFGPLPAGEYELSRQGDAGPMTVSVPAGEVTFKATEYNAMRVSIRDAEGTMAKAGLADGDLIVGVDGVEFTGMRQMQMLLGGAMMKGEVTLNLLRGRRRIELDVNLREAMRDPDARPGGTFRPATR
ncbi:MAG: hypothetical protein AAGD14_13325 [Planctomycetota bacterium]